jgi:hypothetical protein
VTAVVPEYPTLLAVIGPGERGKAVNALAIWVAEVGSEYIKIVDPYFGPQELHIIASLSQVLRGLRFLVITSRKHHHKVEQPWERVYSEYWRTRVSEEAPPDIEVCVVGLEGSGDPLNHDRYWLTKGAGLKSGSSANAFGADQIFSLTCASEGDRLAAEARADAILAREIRSHSGEKVIYTVFTVGCGS